MTFIGVKEFTDTHWIRVDQVQYVEERAGMTRIHLMGGKVVQSTDSVDTVMKLLANFREKEDKQ